MPVSKSSHHKFISSSVAVEAAGKLPSSVKSELDCLPVVEQAASSASTSVSSVSLPCRQLTPADVCVSVSLKQESSELLSCRGCGRQTGLVTGCKVWREHCERDLLSGVEVKREPLSPTDDTSCLISSPRTDCQLSSSDCPLDSAVTSVCSQTTATELMVGSGNDEMTVADMQRDCDNLPAAAAAADVDNGVNVTMSQSLAVSSEASHLSVSSPAVSSPVCNSHRSSASASASVVGSTAASVHQELIRCRDSSGKTYYVPRGLLVRVQSSSTVNCTKSQAQRSLPSTCCDVSSLHSASVASATVLDSRVSSGKGDSSSPVCGVDVVIDKTDCRATEQQPSVTTTTPCGLSNPMTNSATLCHAVTTAALTTVTLPSSAQDRLALSCGGHTSVLTNTAVTSRHVHTAFLMSDKVRMASMPYSVLNNAVIKPRPLVPLSTVNSPVRSLPHITVLRSVSPVVMSAGRNKTPVNNVSTARLPTSSNPPMYLVVEGNNRVPSSNSRAIKEVVLVPGTKNATVQGIKMCSLQSASAAGVNGRCTKTLSAGSSQCDGLTKVSDNSVSSSLQSVCVTSLNRVCKSAQMLPHSGSQISLLRPQNVALSTVITKPSSVEPKMQMKRTSSSCPNVIATKIGNQTVIVDVGNLSSGGLAAIKPSVTTESCACSTKPKDLLMSKPACSQQDVTSLHGDVLLHSSAPRVHVASDLHNPSTAATDDTSRNCAPVIR